MDIVIRNGTLITPSNVFPADVGIIGERVVTLGEGLSRRRRGAVELDATGCYVLPGAIDPHVHLQMPVGAYVSADDFTSGTVAAACGGTTTVIDFVEPTISLAKVQNLRKAYSGSERAPGDPRRAMHRLTQWTRCPPKTCSSLPPPPSAARWYPTPAGWQSSPNRP